jgi:hypothetical protein
VLEHVGLECHDGLGYMTTLIGKVVARFTGMAVGNIHYNKLIIFTAQ